MISMKALTNSSASGARRKQKRRGGLSALAAAMLLPALLAGCTGLPDQAATGPAITGDDLAKYAPGDEAYRKGTEHFTRGEYGSAEPYFREAAESAPRNASVWIALAACYDRLNRFDLADRAYANAIRLAGETAQILNNQGYSYMLRGNVAGAKVKFAKARALAPRDPLVQNNVELLGNSAQYLRNGG
jgi:Flp pilus assembly protein TadD